MKTILTIQTEGNSGLTYETQISFNNSTEDGHSFDREEFSGFEPRPSALECCLESGIYI